MSRIRYNRTPPPPTASSNLASVGHVNAQAQFEQSAVPTVDMVAELIRGASAPLPPQKDPVAHT
ncbi:hypothetical protein NONI108955_19740 [Nocardia ninae]|uniref:Uncharacterized protein n=1 Tax=Nocardia ninae NBRC 108245 TaxID=1210091 RepID=A0A511M8V3_9NOCA|nr:hypothetical protein NN4_11660 [Nocardia ninae NBRC 108245]